MVCSWGDFLWCRLHSPLHAMANIPPWKLSPPLMRTNIMMLFRMHLVSIGSLHPSEIKIYFFLTAECIDMPTRALFSRYFLCVHPLGWWRLSGSNVYLPGLLFKCLSCYSLNFSVVNDLFLSQRTYAYCKFLCKPLYAPLILFIPSHSYLLDVTFLHYLRSCL